MLDSLGLSHLRVSSEEVLHLNSVVDHVFSPTSEFDTKHFSEEEVTALYVYKVPKMSLDGTCSRADILAENPFNLATHLCSLTKTSTPTMATETFSFVPRLLVNHPTTSRLAKLNAVVHELYTITRADWIGIYRLMSTDNTDIALMKEAYRGDPSRAIFPVTSSFAAKSTNSWVALTGNVRIIENTRVREEGVSYYECSGKVQSELCVPIFSGTKRGENGSENDHEDNDEDEESSVIGIIDLESWSPSHFSAKIVLEVLKVALDLGAINFGIRD